MAAFLFLWHKLTIMNWTKAGKDQYGYEREYFIHGNWVFKKKKRPTDTVTIYEVWEGEIMQKNTVFEWEFKKIVSEVIYGRGYKGARDNGRLNAA